MFRVRERGSTVGREFLGGATTFMSMSYILFVQPAILSQAGMDSNGVFIATCISSAIACVLMGVLANYPIALAPGMGENVFFAVTLSATMGAWGLAKGWEMALALTVLSGGIFLLLSVVGFRSRVLNAIPDSLKSGIACGIGLFIAVVGFSYGNLVVPGMGGAPVAFPGLHENPVAWLTLIGLGITLAMMAFRVHGAILIGILATTAIALIWGKAQWQMPVAWPRGLSKTAGGFVPGFVGVFKALGNKENMLQMLVFTFVLLFMDLFDTVGTLVGVASRAGLMRKGRLPRAERGLMADATGTVIGGCLGTSTITSYIESVTGVQAGARTGLSAVVVGGLMLVAAFFQPLVQTVVGEFQVAGYPKFPTIAPALIIVGGIMLRTIREIDWDDVTEYLPAFLTMITMPLAYSISTGIAMGFVSYAFGKLVTGRARQCPLIVYIFAVLFVVRYAVC